jgi:hypothetical protein
MKALLLLLALVLGGCGATANNTQHVVVGLEPDTGCRELGRVCGLGESKLEARSNIKVEADRLGANYVKLSALTKQPKGARYKLLGTAFDCR